MIQDWFTLTDEQIQGVLDYIETHREEVEAEYQQVLAEAAEIRHSYLFLRRLENRLQMFDEEQTHELPDEFDKRLIVAKSMNIGGETDSEIIDLFETEKRFKKK